MQIELSKRDALDKLSEKRKNLTENLHGNITRPNRAFEGEALF